MDYAIETLEIELSQLKKKLREIPAELELSSPRYVNDIKNNISTITSAIVTLSNTGS